MAKKGIREYKVFCMQNAKVKIERLERGGPCWLFETDTNGVSKSTNVRGFSLVASLGSSCRYKRFLSCLGCTSRPVHNIFFLPVHYFNAFVSIAQQVGQAGVQGRLSLNMCPRVKIINSAGKTRCPVCRESLWIPTEAACFLRKHLFNFSPRECWAWKERKT